MKPNYFKVLLLLAFGGFALMLIDVRYMHRDILGDEWQSWIPLIVSAGGMIVTGLVLITPRARFIAVSVYLAGAISGVYGAYLHSEGDVGRFMDLFASRDFVVYADDGDERRGEKEHESKNMEPPLLAPLGLAGLCAFATVGAMGVGDSTEGK